MQELVTCMLHMYDIIGCLINKIYHSNNFSLGILDMNRSHRKLVKVHLLMLGYLMKLEKKDTGA